MFVNVGRAVLMYVQQNKGFIGYRRPDPDHVEHVVYIVKTMTVELLCCVMYQNSDFKWLVDIGCCRRLYILYGSDVYRDQVYSYYTVFLNFVCFLIINYALDVFLKFFFFAF